MIMGMMMMMIRSFNWPVAPGLRDVTNRNKLFTALLVLYIRSGDDCLVTNVNEKK